MSSLIIWLQPLLYTLFPKTAIDNSLNPTQFKLSFLQYGVFKCTLDDEAFLSECIV